MLELKNYVYAIYTEENRVDVFFDAVSEERSILLYILMAIQNYNFDNWQYIDDREELQALIKNGEYEKALEHYNRYTRYNKVDYSYREVKDNSFPIKEIDAYMCEESTCGELFYKGTDKDGNLVEVCPVCESKRIIRLP